MFLFVALSVSDFIVSTLELFPYPIKGSNSKIENVSHTTEITPWSYLLSVTLKLSQTVSGLVLHMCYMGVSYSTSSRAECVSGGAVL